MDYERYTFIVSVEFDYLTGCSYIDYENYHNMDKFYRIMCIISCTPTGVWLLDLLLIHKAKLFKGLKWQIIERSRVESFPQPLAPCISH